MRFMTSWLSRRKRLTTVGGLAMLGLLLSACSPGIIVSAWNTTSGATAFRGSFIMTCKAAASNTTGNCVGAGTANIGGVSFVTNSGTGGTGDLNNSPPSNCTVAPCSQDAGIAIYGTGTFGGQPATYALTAYDNDPSTADNGTLTVNKQSHSFTCTGCVEVIMQPGSTPGGTPPIP